MASSAFDLNHRPRELRRRAVLPARMRIGARWSDACILNISSHGLMIRTASRVLEDSVVEIRRGNHVIFARVVWRRGRKAGLQADERLPVEDILMIGQSPALQLTAADALMIERRKNSRRVYQDSRQRARGIQFISAVVIAAGLAAAVLSMVEQATAVPLAMIEVALGS
jgi:hypothetical protein